MPKFSMMITSDVPHPHVLIYIVTYKFEICSFIKPCLKWSLVSLTDLRYLLQDCIVADRDIEVVQPFVDLKIASISKVTKKPKRKHKPSCGLWRKKHQQDERLYTTHFSVALFQKDSHCSTDTWVVNITSLVPVSTICAANNEA